MQSNLDFQMRPATTCKLNETKSESLTTSRLVDKQNISILTTLSGLNYYIRTLTRNYGTITWTSALQKRCYRCIQWTRVPFSVV